MRKTFLCSNFVDEIVKSVFGEACGKLYKVADNRFIGLVKIILLYGYFICRNISIIMEYGFKLVVTPYLNNRSFLIIGKKSLKF